MYVNNRKILAKPEGAQTLDIIDALKDIVPISVKNIEDHIHKIITPTGNPIKDAELLAKYVRDNFTYIADGFKEQNIKTPGRLFYDKKGDCKSFSLFILSGLLALGHEAGFRFASYKPNKVYTHVYNFVKHNGKNNTFDSCISNLKESQTYTQLKDMKVNYLSGIGSKAKRQAKRAARKDKRADKKEARQEKRADKKEARKEKRQNKPSVVKKVAFAPARAPFLALVSFNFRNLAKKLAALQSKNPKKLKEFWLKVGGNPDKLLKSVNTGKSKKPLAGGGKMNGANQVVYTAIGDQQYIGLDPASATAAISAASVLLATVQKLLKGEKVEGADEILAPTGTEVVNLDANFEVIDADGEEAKSYQKKSFTPSIGLIGGGLAAAAALYIILKPKRKKR